MGIQSVALHLHASRGSNDLRDKVYTCPSLYTLYSIRCEVRRYINPLSVLFFFLFPNQKCLFFFIADFKSYCTKKQLLLVDKIFAPHTKSNFSFSAVLRLVLSTTSVISSSSRSSQVYSRRSSGDIRLKVLPGMATNGNRGGFTLVDIKLHPLTSTRNVSFRDVLITRRTAQFSVIAFFFTSGHKINIGIRIIFIGRR